MKIGILTFHWALNYGAVLQTYALQTVLERMGHQIEIIDYRPKWSKDNATPRFPRRLGEVVNIADHYMRRHNFNKFLRKYLKLTDYSYLQGEAINGFDCIITGSDQVFNPDIIDHVGNLDTTYLLASVPQGTKRMSYAASFGNSSLSSKYGKQFQQLLAPFCAIGIRENSGKTIVDSLNLKATPVPDPTILLGDFSSLSNQNSLPSDNYILNSIFQETDTVHSIQNVIRSESAMPVLPILGLHAKLKRKKGYYNLSPENWIKAIRNAHFVITDSFHSTVFCILYHRPFVSLALDAWGNDWSERIKALLEKVDLKDRLLQSPSPKIVRETYHKPIAWEKVEKQLDSWRVDGLTFLTKHLIP